MHQCPKLTKKTKIPALMQFIINAFGIVTNGGITGCLCVMILYVLLSGVPFLRGVQDSLQLPSATFNCRGSGGSTNPWRSQSALERSPGWK